MSMNGILRASNRVRRRCPFRTLSGNSEEKSMSCLVRFTRGLAAVLLWPALVSAQFYSMYGPQSSMVGVYTANMQYLMNNSSLMVLQAQVYQNQRRAGQAGGQQPVQAPPAVVRRAPGNFTFPYQGRLLSMDEMAASITRDPAMQRRVAGELGELVRTVADDLKRGGSPYDLAKAFTLFTTTMYSVLNPGAPITERTMDRLAMQFRCELLDEAGMRTSPETLQKQWEALVALSGWTLMAYEMGYQKQNRELLASLREAARTALQAVFQIDPLHLRIDPNAEWPLSVNASASSAGGGWGQGTPGAAPVAASPSPAPSSQSWGSWGSQPPPSPSGSSWGSAAQLPAGGRIRVGHHHFVTGMHPASLIFGDAELVFDPEGQTCNQPRVSAPYSAVQVREPAVNGNGELLLNIRMPDPRNPKKMINLNFASENSWVDTSSGAAIVRSPADAIDALRAIAAELRRRGAR
jgi:hypothetical protein